MTKHKHIAIRIDDENNTEAFYDALREVAPKLERSLSKNGAAVISAELWTALTSLPGWECVEAPEYAPHPLIDCGSEGDQWADVVASRHEVFDELR